MKKKLLVFLSFFIFALLLIPLNVHADTTDNLLIDIKINADGSLFVRELATLEGSYNGRLRNIDFANPNTKKFTGLASDFSGSDIYNGSAIKDLKVYDVKYSKIITFSDMDRLNKKFEKTNSADSGDYGVYELNTNSYGVDLKIYNPSSSNTAFYIEYIVKDAVVVHNDIAELAWNILGTDYKEDIPNLQIKITLPNKDPDLRGWLHATLEAYGDISVKDGLYTLTIYKDLPSYNPVSVRMMFDKNLVPNATKKSGIAGKEYILAYEQAEADKANDLREKAYEELYQKAEEAVSNAEEYLTYEYYKDAYERVDFLKDTDERKQLLLNRLVPLEELIDKEMIKRAEIELATAKRHLTTATYNSASDTVSKIVNVEKKLELEKELSIIYDRLQTTLLIKRLSVIVITIAFVVATIIIYIKTKKKNLSKSSFDMEYFRDFPSEDGPEVIDYLMNKKITNNSFSAIILNLIRKKAITLETIDSKKNDYKFIKNNNYQKELNYSENSVMSLLFDLVGNKEEVKLNDIKNYGNTESKANKFIKIYTNFTNISLKKAKESNFFELKSGKAIYIMIYLIICIFISILYFWAEISEFIVFIPFILLVALIPLACLRIYTEYGIDQYKKWKAHKKFLQDFGRFNEKELPEIVLWEKYLVYATVLGCAKELQKAMAIHIERMEATISTNDLTTIYIMNSIIRSNLTNTISSAVTSSISKSYSTIAANSSSASGGGFGGGSSGGGGSFGGGGGGGRF